MKMNEPFTINNLIVKSFKHSSSPTATKHVLPIVCRSRSYLREEFLFYASHLLLFRTFI